MRAQEFVNEKWSKKYKSSINCANPKGFSQRAHCQGRKKNEDLNEFAPDEGGGSRKFIPWTEFVEQVKQLVSKDFSCKENVVKSTIKARFVPHDPMEYGPTMLYSYYETRAGGRNKGAVSTRGSIQVGKYTKGGLFGQAPNQLLTGFHLLKGHPFERHFDLTFDNIYKIANIILGNTEGALEFKPEGVTEGYLNEFAPGGGSASSYYAVTSNFVNEFAQQKQEELQDLIDAGWTKQDLAQAGTLAGQAADIAHFEQVRDGFLKGLKPGFDTYLQGDTQLKDQLGAYWLENDLPLNQDWEKIYGEPWGDDGEFDEGRQLDELQFKGSECTKDCSGHMAGYDWSIRKAGKVPNSHSPSFNKGAAIQRAGL